VTTTPVAASHVSGCLLSYVVKNRLKYYYYCTQKCYTWHWDLFVYQPQSGIHVTYVHLRAKTQSFHGK